ncbi:hypothetical protein [Mycobacterium asiaticum]|uniref:hypothetical protein n=1 Tax=Mycobacterium asiaticum TaxID=1790 RepID=UPI0007EF1D77|nr:hypothetical protein [Mycobacterium asiaticum]OBJ52432.1 hypothetical protein A9W94_24805 [Mycobacterium asiaticum]
MTAAAKKRTPAAAKTAGAAAASKSKPGDKDFDWQSEYPGEEVFVFTASDGVTIGLTKLGPKRRPKPGKLALLDEEQGAGIKVLWYFLKLASSDASRALQAELEEEDYAAMSRQWAEFAGIELGE